MRLSSIFSSSTYQVRIRVPWWLAYLLVLLILAEVALRIPFVVGRLPRPEPSLWHADLIQTKLDYLRAFESQRGVDVLLIGNSTMQAGVNPQVFDTARGKPDSNEPGSFNAAVEGLPPYGAQIFLEIFLRYTHPRLIIYGITPQDLNSNSPWARDVSDRINHSPLAMAEARSGLLGILNAGLLEYSRLYRYRLLLFYMLLNGTAKPVPSAYFDERGYHSIDLQLSNVSPVERRAFRNKAGVLHYSTEGIQLDSLRSLVTYSQAHDIDLLLVNMPLADDYYGNFDSPKDYQTYLSTLTRLASEMRIPLLDLEGVPPETGFGDSDFADFNHLNKEGAHKLSRLLGREYPKLLANSARVN